MQFLSCSAEGVDTQADFKERQKFEIEARENTANIFKVVAIQHKAKEMCQEGYYDEGIKKYREALSPRFKEVEQGGTWGGIRGCLHKQNKYEEALEVLQWHLERNFSKYEQDKLELEALIKARDTKSPEPIYSYIEWFKNKYHQILPPEGMNGYSSILSTYIIRLYDHIGDQDKALEFLDSYNRFHAEVSGLTTEKIEVIVEGKKNSVKQGLLQDKADGFKGCLEANPGDACMGRATKALIMSGRF